MTDESGQPFHPPIRAEREPAFHRLLDALPAGAYTCVSSGQITYYNAYAADVWGRQPQLNAASDRWCGSLRLFATDGSPSPTRTARWRWR